MHCASNSTCPPKEFWSDGATTEAKMDCGKWKIYPCIQANGYFHESTAAAPITTQVKEPQRCYRSWSALLVAAEISEDLVAIQFRASIASFSSTST